MFGDGRGLIENNDIHGKKHRWYKDNYVLLILLSRNDIAGIKVCSIS